MTTQPSLAMVLEALELTGRERLLEIGTGYGFQAALLARLVAFVWSVERWESLAEAARKNLARNGVENVEVVVGDGSEGLQEHAPYDAIVVSAAFTSVPPPLAQQLAEGGYLVQPIGRGGTDRITSGLPGAILRVQPVVVPGRRCLSSQCRRRRKEGHMHARLSRFAGLPPERIDQTLRQFEKQQLPVLEQQQGYRGVMVMVNRGTGQAAAITIWETREDMRESAKVADRARAAAVETAQPSREPVVDSYEVLVMKQLASTE